MFWVFPLPCVLLLWFRVCVCVYKLTAATSAVWKVIIRARDEKEKDTQHERIGTQVCMRCVVCYAINVCVHMSKFIVYEFGWWVAAMMQRTVIWPEHEHPHIYVFDYIQYIYIYIFIIYGGRNISFLGNSCPSEWLQYRLWNPRIVSLDIEREYLLLWYNYIIVE